jgi:uncharacterized protein
MKTMQGMLRAMGLAMLLLGLAPAVASADVRELKWSDLIPKGWDPLEEMRRTNPTLTDDSPQTMQALRSIWDSAPTVATLEGSRVKLPGYVVPLEASEGKVKEFLLVPYFGACIHSPPPPANQIVFVDAARTKAAVKTMDVVWVQGTLRVKRQDSVMGFAGYRLEASSIAPYTNERR